jgi:hypothetical protein
MIIVTTWLLGVAAVVRLIAGPAPGATPADAALIAGVLLWAVWTLSAKSARRRREADLDAAIIDALEQARRAGRRGATMVRG